MGFLSIDPGTRCVGWARWGEALLDCGLARTKCESLGDRAHDLASQIPSGDYHIVVEVPRVYPYHRKMRPNDLIDLAFVGGMCGLRGTSTSIVHPVEWKGQLPKEVCHKRCVELLAYNEVAGLKLVLESTPKSLQHNLLDAIGIGLWYGKRS